MTQTANLSENKPQQLGRFEFVIMCAMLTCLTALSIDAMLPALPMIGEDLAVANINHTQLVVSVLFAGFALGQLIAGPMSDSFGRKKPIFLGLTIFLIGSAICVWSNSFEAMLLGRFLQGLGASAPRIVTMAMVRDLFSGRDMAQVMSFIMSVFIIVPALAPALGQLVLYFAPWRWIFLCLALMAMTVFVWFALRQPETLDRSKRLPFSFKQVFAGISETVRTRTSIGYTIGSGIIFGGFVSYLSMSQLIFHDIYESGDKFALYFGILSLAIGCASLFNGRFVHRYGMRRLLLIALVAKVILSLGFLPYVYLNDGVAGLWVFMGWGMLVFFCTGILFGNFSALALEPLGHIAGVGASTFGAISTFMAAGLGFAIGQTYNGTLIPLVGGFSILAMIGLVVVLWTDRRF
ncbi:MAG: multidrug effflux MFS transporter [Alphaproteobacteria bacterium]|nr:multidrug effflux MFS transporter [Alphaproteobacteria bacterium]